MIEYIKRDVAVIGAGAAGLFAAAETMKGGCSTIVIDREQRAGGILNQCIHNGFGLHCFKEELTGPEFAAKAFELAKSADAEFRFGTTVRNVTRNDDGTFTLEMLSRAHGVTLLDCKAVIMAVGCRERNRGNLAVPGRRPAGVWTAGTAQKLLNVEGVIPGKSAVIIGSGDIGLIMARRMSWCGVKVQAVIEIMPRPSGLVRNIAQCLDDFNIPLHLSHQVVNIHGTEHVTGVDAAPLVGGKPDMENVKHFDCDTILFSVGLVPSNELMLPLGVEIDPNTGGAKVDSNGETNVPGIFVAGNALHVHDLVDFVAEEAAETAHAVVRKLNGTAPCPHYAANTRNNLRYVAPLKFASGEKIHFRFRPTITCEKAILTACDADGNEIKRWTKMFVCPAEMIQIELDAPGSDITFNLEEVK